MHLYKKHAFEEANHQPSESSQPQLRVIQEVKTEPSEPSQPSQPAARSTQQPTAEIRATHHKWTKEDEWNSKGQGYFGQKFLHPLGPPRLEWLREHTNHGKPTMEKYYNLESGQVIVP